MRRGIIGGGNLIVDNIKLIDYYPEKNMMCNIVEDPMTSVGGCPHNVLIDLARMEVNIPLFALGLVGEDQGGDLVIQDFENHKIDTKYVQKTSHRKTSFTDAMIEVNTGQRTFFHYGGANSELDFEHFIKAGEESNAKIFHLANLLHLDKLDSPDPEYGLISAKVLKYLKEKGFLTSVDLVSVISPLFQQINKFCLKYINYLIINEIEAERLSEINIRGSNGINKENLEKTGEFLIKNGVNDLVVIHFPEGGYAINKNLEHFYRESYKVEGKEIKSAVGAGDAFCSGILYGLHEDLPINEVLSIANGCARFNLFDATATGGAKSLKTILEFLNSVNRQSYESQGN
jgi:sugar/nucleoside kinase (ribokinase family)